MILVTGGTGYIGSHTVVELLAKNEEVLIVDNLVNSSIQVLDKIEKISSAKVIFERIDLTRMDDIRSILFSYPITSVIHFAAYKSVGESVNEPLKYYENNLLSLINILRFIEEKKIQKFVFSSSCTVYGSPETIPVDESFPIAKGESPYGKTKIMGEEIILDFYKNYEGSACLLRYFNPIGSHDSGLIGDEPDGIPNNLLPYVTQVAAQEHEFLNVFGNDYYTPDGSCLRDYVHVVDLAKAHLAALDFTSKNKGIEVFNIGTGEGTSVIELIETFEKVNNVKVPYKIVDRRKGDVEAIYANPLKAKQRLGWEAKLGLNEMLSSAWKFQKQLKRNHEN